MILMKATTSNIFDSISNTCRRFKSLLEERKEAMVHIDFPEKLYHDLPRRSNKVKVSVKKLSMCFGPASSIIECISKGIGKKNWRSAWLLMEKRNCNWFVIERVFWKSKAKEIVHSKYRLQDSNQQPAIDDDVVEVFWLRNDLYFLKQEGEQILLSNNASLNDRTMDAAQKLICKEIGTMDSYQSVLNSERKTENPYQPVSQEHVQLLHHWFLTFCSNGRVQICNSLRSSLTPSSKKSIRLLYKNYVPNGGERMTFLPVQKQPDGYNCGAFVIAYAAELLDGQCRSDAVFDGNEMREHLITCLENQILTPFPKVSSA